MRNLIELYQDIARWSEKGESLRTIAARLYNEERFTLADTKRHVIAAMRSGHCPGMLWPKVGGERKDLLAKVSITRVRVNPDVARSIVAMRRQGKSYSYVARMHNVSASYVRNVCLAAVCRPVEDDRKWMRSVDWQKLEASLRPKPAKPEPRYMQYSEVPQALDLRRKDMTLEQIAAEMNVTLESLKYQLNTRRME
jgi:DNA-binding CsgD family transcriptional regulator